MSERLIQVSTLTEIADAIRDKKGTVNPIPVSSYASEIATIETGGGQSDKPFNLVSYFNGTLTEVDDVNGVIEKVGKYVSNSMGNVSPIEFTNQNQLGYVNLPNCSRIGGSWTFSNCYALSSISMPNLKSVVSPYAFYSCSSLENIDLPNCEYINAVSMFMGCDSLKSVNFAKCSSLYGSYIFRDLPNLEYINLENCEEIGSSVFFMYQSSTKVYVHAPKKYLHLGLSNCIELVSYNRGYFTKLNGNNYEALVSTGGYSTVLYHESCRFLATANVSQQLCRITGLSFANVEWVCSNFAAKGANSVTFISLPKCESIGSSAFASGIARLSKLFLPMCSYIGSSAFYGAGTSLTTLENVGAKYIGSYAFYNAKQISSANWSIMEYIGKYAFNSNAALTELPSELSNCSYLAGFTGCSQFTSISNSFAKVVTFEGCTNLVDVDLPNCEEILSYGFARCYSLTSIMLPKCLSVGDSAFSSCSNLTFVDLPMCEFVGSNAFNRLSSLYSVNIPQVITISSSAFYYCNSALETVNMDNCRVIHASAFYGCHLLKSINAPLCEEVSTAAFAYCSALETVNLRGLKRYYSDATGGGAGLFNYCISLQELDLPELETTNGRPMATSCTQLKTISLYKLEIVPAYFVSGCKSLESIYLHASYVIPMSLGATYNFGGTPILSSGLLGYFGSIYVPASLYDEYRTATNWIQLSSRFVSM